MVAAMTGVIGVIIVTVLLAVTSDVVDVATVHDEVAVVIEVAAAGSVGDGVVVALTTVDSSPITCEGSYRENTISVWEE